MKYGIKINKQDTKKSLFLRKDFGLQILSLQFYCCKKGNSKYVSQETGKPREWPRGYIRRVRKKEVSLL